MIWSKISSALGAGKKSAGHGHSQVLVGAAALMIQVAAEHEGISDAEKDEILAGLTRNCGGEKAALDIFEQGAQLQAQATDLYSLTRGIMKQTTHADQCEIMRLLYRVALADGRIDHAEEQILSRIAGLLGVDVRERVNIRQDAERSHLKDKES